MCRGMAAIVLAATLALGGCARLEAPDNHLRQSWERLRATRSGEALSGPTVYVEGSVTISGGNDQRRGSDLADLIREHLLAVNCTLASSPDAADYRVDCRLRGQQSNFAKTVIVGFLTASIYVPITYDWTVQVNIYDRAGNYLPDTYHRGRLHWQSFVYIFVPTTIVQYYQNVAPLWDSLVHEAALTCTGRIQSAGLLQREESQPPLEPLAEPEPLPSQPQVQPPPPPAEPRTQPGQPPPNPRAVPDPLELPDSGQTRDLEAPVEPEQPGPGPALPPGRLDSIDESVIPG